MIEAINNRSNVDSPISLKWANGPLNVPFSEWLKIEQLSIIQPSYLPSEPLLSLGNEIITFQLRAEWQDTHYSMPLHVRFECSNDGINWDQLPGSEFSVDLDNIEIGDADYTGLYTATFEILCSSKYIRMSLGYSGEGFDPTGRVRIIAIQKE